MNVASFGVVFLLVCQVVFTLALLRALLQLPGLPVSKKRESPGHITVVIPAFNEEENIEGCVRSVLVAFQEGFVAGKVVVVDDRSTDSTPEILRKLVQEFPEFLVVLASEAPPPEKMFHGKNRACWSARRVLEGSHVVFVDADVRLAKSALPDALDFAEREQVDLLTLAPSFSFGCLAEWIVQPVMMMFMGALFKARDVNDPSSRHAFAAGPFLLFRRTFYEKMGGHEAVAHEVVEDVAFARMVKAQGGRLRLLSGVRVASLRMYTSMAALWEGWTKNIFIGLERSFALAAFAIVSLFVLFVAPFVFFFSALALVWSGAGEHLSSPLSFFPLSIVSVILVFAARGIVKWKMGIPLGLVWGTPLGAILVMFMVLDSARRVTTRQGWTWKGRSLSSPSSSNTPSH